MEQQKNIHWFPGHMKKALNEISEKIKLIDLVIEILDARAPFSTHNKYLDSLTQNKSKLVIFNKIDIANEQKLNEYIKNSEIIGEQNYILSSIKDASFYTKLLAKLNYFYNLINEKNVKKGLKPQPIKILVCGIPNVGKSSLINFLSKKSSAGVENKPGFTKGQKWIRVSEKYYFLDTPGILPSNYEDKNYARNVALLGSIKQDILPNSELCEYALNYIKENLFLEFKNYYKLDCDITGETDNNILIELICKKRGFLQQNSQFDIERCELTILNDFKNGLIGKIFLDA